MARVFTGSLTNYTGGSYGPFNVPNNATEIRVGLARNTTANPLYWPDPSTVVSISVEISIDNGATWPIAMAWGDAGGRILRESDGSEVDESWGGGGPLPDVNGRKVRGAVTVTGPALRSEFRVEVD